MNEGATSPQQPETLFEKVWNGHVVKPQSADNPAVLYIDLHLIHEVTSPQAFDVLRRRGLRLRRPDKCLATMDHSTPSLPTSPSGRIPFVDALAEAQVAKLVENCREFGVQLFDLSSSRNGIVHVIGPELGATQPGKTIVCGDSHTSTHGAFGALAFGIGTSEVGHVMATQCLLQYKPNTYAVNVQGRLAPGVTAKDLILGLIGKIGIGGGTGHVFEYRGEAIEALGMDERMTVCNMSIEAGARAGMIAPDETTYAYLAGREMAPSGADWDAALACWRALPTDPGATFDAEVDLDAASLEPMITYGTHPGMTMPIRAHVPNPNGSPSEHKALQYMGLEPGQQLLGHKVDVVFIGSCTNSRIQDLRQAATVFKDRKVASGMRALIVPGSKEVKVQAEAEGLDRIFREAGAEWREPSCSMCIAMNGDQLSPGEYAVSTSNRNFEGRQGKGSRTFLASPLTAAATAVRGVITDARELGGV
ncbi:3-isopropylmalate dehydratase large subunit [Sulfidibacter corallicola]|uniref:3-isopropylmalate dehydratase large subunit n=1 Tax=Sulfidibacter corallicola TaxID=2818388 RepID=A0A8A4TRH2_SULCO|nr:3-isopropylmalate dehydratase large subunit [Sulfidibacter corallicola]QTD52150.1 3-isopropylmalate dehydratase large subunit [Sulfidibacter corallicola]